VARRHWATSGRSTARSLPGATAASLIIANVQTANAGNYQAIVTNAYGSATSEVATLTVSVATNIAYLRTLVDAINYAPTDTNTLFIVQGVVTTRTNLTIAGNTEFFIQDATAASRSSGRGRRDLTTPHRQGPWCK